MGSTTSLLYNDVARHICDRTFTPLRLLYIHSINGKKLIDREPLQIVDGVKIIGTIVPPTSKLLVVDVAKILDTTNDLFVYHVYCLVNGETAIAVVDDLTTEDAQMMILHGGQITNTTHLFLLVDGKIIPNKRLLSC